MIVFTLTPIATAHKADTGCSDGDLLGEIPTWLSEGDPAGTVEQIDRAYKHGGGWRDFKGHVLDIDRGTLKYPGDPEIPAIAAAKLHDERIMLFDGAWLAVIQPNGSHRIARID